MYSSKDQLLKEVEGIITINDNEVVVNDKNALVKLGVNPNLVVVFGMAPYKLAEDLMKITRRVVLLVDLDKEGKKIYWMIKGILFISLPMVTKISLAVRKAKNSIRNTSGSSCWIRKSLSR